MDEGMWSVGGWEVGYGGLQKGKGWAVAQGFPTAHPSSSTSKQPLVFLMLQQHLNGKQNWYLRVFNGFVSADFLPFEAKFQHHLALQWQLFMFYAPSVGLLCWGNGNSLNGNKIKLLWPLGNQKSEKLAWSNRTYCELALILPPALWAAHVDHMQALLGQWFMRWHIDLGKKHISSIITQLFHCVNCTQKVSK